MKIYILLIIAFLGVRISYSQNEIRRIIYDDLLLLNSLYDGCIIQKKQSTMKIVGNDSLIEVNTLFDFEDSLDRVSILYIDSILGYYIVDVKFSLISNSQLSGLFLGEKFRYVLYKEGNRYYKIDGFIVSEILLPVSRISYNLKYVISKRSKQIEKHIRKRNLKQISNFLTVSIIEKINQMGYKINRKPYVKDILCF